MRWSIKIARIAGTEVRIHFTFLLFIAWIGLSYYIAHGTAAAMDAVLSMLALFGCVLLHEFGHATAARYFGIPTPDITILPIGGVARLERMPDKPWQELIVAVAGPLVNVCIITVLLLILNISAPFQDFDEAAQPGLLNKLVVVNIVLVLFNLIPAFPMDGGRVLRGLLAMALPFVRATRIAASIGKLLAIGFFAFGLTTNPMLMFIAVFIYMGAEQEMTLARLKELTAHMPVSEAMMTQLVTLSRNATVNDAVEAMTRTTQHDFPILDESGQVLGVLTRDDVNNALRESGPQTLAGWVMHRDLPVLEASAPFEEAFGLMQESSCPALIVVDRWRRLAGLVTPEKVGEMLLVHPSPPPVV